MDYFYNLNTLQDYIDKFVQLNYKQNEFEQEIEIINKQIDQNRGQVDIRAKQLEIICLQKQLDFVQAQIQLLKYKYRSHVELLINHRQRGRFQ